MKTKPPISTTHDEQLQLCCNNALSQIIWLINPTIWLPQHQNKTHHGGNPTIRQPQHQNNLTIRQPQHQNNLTIRQSDNRNPTIRLLAIFMLTPDADASSFRRDPSSERHWERIGTLSWPTLRYRDVDFLKCDNNKCGDNLLIYYRKTGTVNLTLLKVCVIK